MFIWTSRSSTAQGTMISIRRTIWKERRQIRILYKTTYGERRIRLLMEGDYIRRIPGMDDAHVNRWVHSFLCCSPLVFSNKRRFSSTYLPRRIQTFVVFFGFVDLLCSWVCSSFFAFICSCLWFWNFDVIEVCRCKDVVIILGLWRIEILEKFSGTGNSAVEHEALKALGVLVRWRVWFTYWFSCGILGDEGLGIWFGAVWSIRSRRSRRMLKS